MHAHVNPSFRCRCVAGLPLTALKRLAWLRADCTLRLKPGTRDPGGLTKGTKARRACFRTAIGIRAVVRKRVK